MKKRNEKTCEATQYVLNCSSKTHEQQFKAVQRSNLEKIKIKIQRYVLCQNIIQRKMYCTT